MQYLCLPCPPLQPCCTCLQGSYCMVMIMNYDAAFENENSEVLMLFGGSNGFKGILIRIIDGHHSSVIVVRVKFMRDMGNTPKETNPGPGVLLPQSPVENPRHGFLLFSENSNIMKTHV